MNFGQVRCESLLSHRFTRKAASSASFLSKEYFVYPLFVSLDIEDSEEIKCFPNQRRWNPSKIVDFLTPLCDRGLAAVMLFGTVKEGLKDEYGSAATTESTSPVLQAVKVITKSLPQLYIVCDVCLCAYTETGHCAILKPDGEIDMERSIKRLMEMALSFAEAGAHCVAPSDMLDYRVLSIKNTLLEHNRGSVAIMAHSAKFCSSLYGPFRDAANSGLKFGNRKAHQLPPGSSGLAIRCALRDAEQGADMLIVKPGTLYLDILSEIRRQLPHHVLAVYHVSGECAMLHAGAKAGVIDFDKVLLETMTAFRRAGATVIITYFTPELLDLIDA